MPKRKKTDIVQFKIRLRETLRRQLEAAAHTKDISLNSEIVSRLEQSFVQASLQDLIAEGRKGQSRLVEALRSLSAELYEKVEQEYLLGRIETGNRLRRVAAELREGLDQEPELPMAQPRSFPTK